MAPPALLRVPRLIFLLEDAIHAEGKVVEQVMYEPTLRAQTHWSVNQLEK